MNDIKKYLCKRCDRSFSRSEHLQRHERSHTKEKPFRCTACTKAFTRKDLLNRHTRISHGPLECDTVDVAQTKNATSSSSLTRDLSPVLTFNNSNFMMSENHSPVENHQLQLSNIPIVHSLEESDEIITGQYTAVPSSLGFVRENRAPSHTQTLCPLNSSFDSSLYIADDFTSFLDSVSVPGHPYSPTYQPLPPFVDFTLQQSNENEMAHVNDAHQQRGMNTEYGSRRSRLGSRLPSLTPEETQNNYRTALEPKINPTLVTSRCRDRILASLAHNTDPLFQRLTLPSRHALSRFISGYITGFHDHYPFLHIATLNVEIMAVELILAISALGAQYCREPKQSVELFHIAKVVAMGHIHSSQSRVGHSTPNARLVDSPDKQQKSPADQAPIISANEDHATANKEGNIETVQALLLLIALATWFQEYPPFHEALYLRSVLDTLARGGSFEVHSNDNGGSWEEWIRLETVKRTKFIVFCFFNIHTIVFDLPPMILSGEIVSSLPCTEKEWKADNKTTWQAARNSQEPEPNFQEVLRSLFDYDSNPRKVTRFSSLGGYILIHALIQHIWILRQVAWLPPRNSQSLNPTEIKSLEQALKRWRYCWERNQESSLDPLSPHGPLAFTSTALLRLAYIRISTDVSCVKLLSTWNPYQIAQSLSRSPPTQRGDRVHMAALHCAHALSIPIKLGINFVAQTQVVLWSNQHALCSLECAFLLTNWLQSVTVRDIQPSLTQQEMRLLDFIIELVMETEYKAERDWLLDNNKRLSAIIARLWAKLFRSDGIWEMVALIGKSLNMYADILDSQST